MEKHGVEEHIWASREEVRGDWRKQHPEKPQELYF
jgi:hypothetical protein